jgi:ATP-dependent Clp endopeptidase proteolytic subunit ClpP
MDNVISLLGSGGGSNNSDILDRVFYLDDYVEAETVMPIVSAIIDINKSDKYLKAKYALDGLVYTPKPIEIYISSYGGSVYDGLALVGAIESSVVPVHTIVTGKAMSMGLIISIVGHKRFATNYSTFMYHQVSSQIWGTVQHMEEDLVEAQRLQKVLEGIVTSKTLISEKRLAKIKKLKKDAYMDTQEAYEYGLIDEIT